MKSQRAKKHAVHIATDAHNSHFRNFWLAFDAIGVTREIEFFKFASGKQTRWKAETALTKART